MTGTDDAVYIVERLTKRYRSTGPPANDDISLTIAAGTYIGIFGPNGAGKTTLVRQLMALLKPTAGVIRLFGRDVVREPAVVPRYVGYYGQRVVALRNHTLKEVLVSTGVLRGTTVATARYQAAELIERFELGDLAQRRLATLSGGEQRLAVLLATFVGSPPVLIFDEPTNELDPLRRRSFWSYVGGLNHTVGTTVILTTHNLTEAEQVVEHVAIIDRGRLLALGTPGELKRRVADHVRLEVRLRENRVEAAEARLATLHGAERLRPGHWRVIAPQELAATLLPLVIERVGLDALDDFRLITPSLEDVYVHITGQHWQNGGSAQS